MVVCSSVFKGKLMFFPLKTKERNNLRMNHQNDSSISSALSLGFLRMGTIQLILNSDEPRFRSIDISYIFVLLQKLSYILNKSLMEISVL
jgi:hypothetical protein